MSKKKSTKNRGTLVVSRKQAIALMEGLCFTTANKWSDEKLVNKLNKLPELIDTETTVGDMKDSALNDFMEQIVTAVGDGIKIMTKKTTTTTTKKTKKTKKSKPGAETTKAPATERAGKSSKKKVKKTTPAAAPKKGKVERDEYGNKANSQAGKINAVLLKAGKKHVTAEQIEKKTGLTRARINGHLSYLIDKGFAKSSDEGYRGKPSKKK